mmetsp:Transcript_32501/g.71522  ORF Transcript_32501/g.71522 Transcript_32501/m.71522 type:complete len:207 (-) Transcript_32501:1034-1654(-)
MSMVMVPTLDRHLSKPMSFAFMLPRSRALGSNFGPGGLALGVTAAPVGLPSRGRGLIGPFPSAPTSLSYSSESLSLALFSFFSLRLLLSSSLSSDTLISSLSWSSSVLSRKSNVSIRPLPARAPVALALLTRLLNRSTFILRIRASNSFASLVFPSSLSMFASKAMLFSSLSSQPMCPSSKPSSSFSVSRGWCTLPPVPLTAKEPQ